jgi:hypothetical protein
MLAEQLENALMKHFKFPANASADCVIRISDVAELSELPNGDRQLGFTGSLLFPLSL